MQRFFMCYNQTKIGERKMVDYGLKNRVAIITGANNPQGIGATTALAFAREEQRWF